MKYVYNLVQTAYKITFKLINIVLLALGADSAGMDWVMLYFKHCDLVHIPPLVGPIEVDSLVDVRDDGDGCCVAGTLRPGQGCGHQAENHYYCDLQQDRKLYISDIQIQFLPFFSILRS